jgi:hypothetical protein
MINIPVDEAYAFDMLSILEIKASEDPSLKDNMIRFAESLVDELSFFKFSDIGLSKEYKDLKDANHCIFQRINEMKKREATGEDAIYIDSMNYQRFLAKKELQKKFFPESALSEQKLGYNK